MDTLKKFRHSLVIIILLAVACKTPEQLAAERAAKETAYVQQLQGKYAADLMMAPPLYLPGGMIVKQLQAPCADFDSGTVKSKDGQLTVQAPCPEVKVNVDSIVRNSQLYKNALLGRRLEELRAGSLQRKLDKTSSERDEYATQADIYKAQRNKAYWWLAGIGALLLLYILLKSKIGAAFGFIKGIFK